MAPAPPDGFAEFVAARSAVLLRAAWLLTGDAGRAEDLLQTVLATVWPQWPRIAAGGNPEAYVRRALYTTYLCHPGPARPAPPARRSAAARQRRRCRGPTRRSRLAGG
jgi:hypothetical protein